MRAIGVEGSILAAVLSGIVACGTGADSTAGEPGSPLRGLPDADLARFHAGRVLFDKVYSPQEGLGPAFNENQCSACHTVPASGGAAAFERVVKATRFEPRACDLLSNEGGENIRSQVTPRLRARGVARETIPARATEVARFAPPFLFGLGLVEAIPDADIAARADPDDADGDGISGRVGRTADGRLARFGRKADFATTREFIETALRLEMGLTTPRDTEDRVNGRPPPPGTDPAPDPEVSQGTVALLTAFVQFLAAPAPAAPRSRAQRDTLLAGRRLFDQLGCSACHTPAMRTGPSDVPALRRRTVHLYSDLLLHDMGPGLASVCGRTAAPSEIRTELLMGLGARDRLLHDGRTVDLTEAILAHGGEGKQARDAFAQLPWLRQQYVLIFLRSL
jgi:CxxC motif-containing protein (DUF1111 family)